MYSKLKRVVAIGLTISAVCGCSTEKKGIADAGLDYCDRQVKRTIEELEPIDYGKFPRNIALDSCHWFLDTPTTSWTVGFWPGILWYDYEHTGDEEIKAQAVGFTEALEGIAANRNFDHDLGFMAFCSYGNAYRLTKEERYKQVLLRTADTLATLFNPVYGTILSWPRNVGWLGGHNTIIDNMLNLELLFWASENGGRKEYYDMAVSHADTTMKYGFREDGSSCHVVVYDYKGSGKNRQFTHQGYADNSMWARGQAWAIYGYTMCFRYTDDEKYLDFARRIADIYLNRLPEDMVPYWDFDAPGIPDVPRDASAACITSSALLELCGYVDAADSERYRDAALHMLESLGSNYQSGDRNPSFLLHSTGHHPSGTEIDYSIVYADYYYIEALTRLKALNVR